MPEDQSNTQVQSIAEPTILFETLTVFPFDLFPHKVRLTSVAISVTEQMPLGESNATTLMIQDIMNIVSSTSLLFGSLTLSPRMPTIPPLKIEYLAKNDVERLKNLIQGMMVMNSQNVATSSAGSVQVMQKAESMGQVAAS